MAQKQSGGNNYLIFLMDSRKFDWNCEIVSEQGLLSIDLPFPNFHWSDLILNTFF